MMGATQLAVTLLAVTLLAGGCVSGDQAARQVESGSQAGADSGQEELPAWVTDPGAGHDPGRYMAAVGSGEDLQAARSNAMANLAGRFLSEIEAGQNLYERNVQRMQAGEFTEGFTSTMINTTRIAVEQQLQNTELLESHHAEAEDAYYALMGMDRRQTRELLAEEMQRNDEAIARRHESFLEAGQIHRKLAHLFHNEHLIHANRELLRQKRILSDEPVEEGEYRYGELLGCYEDYLDSISVSLDSGAHSAVDSRVVDILSASGFHIADGQGDLLVEIRQEIEPTDLARDDADFVEWYLYVDIYSLTATGRFHLDTLTLNGRAGALSIEEAENRARRDMVSELEDEFTGFLQTEIFHTNPDRP